MTRRLRNIISFVSFVILLALAIAACAHVLEYKEGKQKYKPFFESETNFDVILLGTSHMWNQVSPMELWKEYGITSYNWGYSNSSPAENYYLLKDIVTYTKPKVVVIDIFGLADSTAFANGKYRTDRIEQQHVQFDALPLSRNKIEGVWDVFDDYSHREDFIWNFIMYHNRWNELSAEDFSYEPSVEKGAHLLTGWTPSSFEAIPEEDTSEVVSVSLQYLLDTLEFCQQEGIQVLCTSIPFPAEEDDQRIANAAGAFVEQYPNCTYVNMLHEDIVDYGTDVWKDGQHLNSSGARKVTAWLGQYLRDHYILDDYSLDDSWTRDYEHFYAYKEEQLLKQKDLPSYLSALQDSDFTATAEVYQSDLLRSGIMQALFANAGIEPVFVEGAQPDASGQTPWAKLSISSAHTGEPLDEVTFYCDDAETLRARLEWAEREAQRTRELQAYDEYTDALTAAEDWETLATVEKPQFDPDPEVEFDYTSIKKGKA